jgi:hypothetical protein
MLRVNAPSIFQRMLSQKNTSLHILLAPARHKKVTVTAMKTPAYIYRII